jgi:predicted metal-dependent enzyme (double-stranded beta helix superfamily)
MTAFFAQFIAKLTDRDWSDVTETHRFLETLLHDINANRELLRDEFRSHSAVQRACTALSSREPSTHFKWLIFRDPLSRFEVWLHEYKNKELLRPGYAVVPHNHVYHLSSLILSGGFRHISYRVTRNVDEEFFQDIRVTDERLFSRDTVYTLTSDAVHSLDDIQDGTTTLVINSASTKPFSEEFNLKSGKIVKHYPLPVRVKDSYPFLDQI